MRGYRKTGTAPATTGQEKEREKRRECRECGKRAADGCNDTPLEMMEAVLCKAWHRATLKMTASIMRSGQLVRIRAQTVVRRGVLLEAPNVLERAKRRSP
jgi:hypothetical protein